MLFTFPGREDGVVPGPSGSNIQLLPVDEYITILAAANTDGAVNFLRAGRWFWNLAWIVISTIPGVATFDIGVVNQGNGSPNPVLFGDGESPVVNANDNSWVNSSSDPFVASANSVLRVTPNVIPSGATGRIHFVGWYVQVQNPNS